jgi:hypothetical protein
VTSSRRPTELAARRMLRALKAHDRLDEVSEAVCALGLVTARMVDEADVGQEKGYALAKLTTAHLGVLIALSRMVGPVDAGDAFAAWLQELSEPTPGTADRF